MDVAHTRLCGFLWFYCSEAPLWFPRGHRWTVELNFGKNIYASSVYWSCPLLALEKKGKNQTFQSCQNNSKVRGVVDREKDLITKPCVSLILDYIPALSASTIWNSSPKNKRGNSVTIYSPSCHFKPVWDSLFHETQKEMFSTMFLLLFSIQWKQTACQSTKRTKKHNKSPV